MAKKTPGRKKIERPIYRVIDTAIEVGTAVNCSVNKRQYRCVYPSGTCSIVKKEAILDFGVAVQLVVDNFDNKIKELKNKKSGFKKWTNVFKKEHCPV